MDRVREAVGRGYHQTDEAGQPFQVEEAVFDAVCKYKRIDFEEERAALQGPAPPVVQAYSVL
ncbi:hypothetical protein T484DRAFT_1842088 [Baffinella frigidus]|nr:hypothetical protein T484DRAFT_1842088 [Cryptophyta sp. CCMP2293]